MKCPECLCENRADAKFCNECGYKFELMCPHCGMSNRPGAKFCDECGHDLKKQKAAPLFGYDEPHSYTPKFLADKILTSRSSIEGERKLVTVLFADVAHYTSISEKMDPEEVHQIMDGCFTILMDEIHRYEGTINQFTGDGVMALFGAPVAHEDHARRACHAALAIQNSLKSYEKQLEEKFGIVFRMRIGLNSGPVVVGSIGDDLRMDYTAVGDTTNLAARMESAAPPGSVLVTKTTHRLVQDFFEFKSLGKIPVKGKKEPQETFELIKTSVVETRIEASVARGLSRFVGRKNSMAALLDALDKVKAGSGQVIGLLGEAGVGKSRLLLEFRNMLPQDKYGYIEGRCLQYGSSMAYLPVLDILRTYFEIKEGDGETLIKKKMDEKILDLDEKLKGVIPPFQALLSLKVDDEDFSKLEPKEKRERTFEALRDLILRMSQEKPLVLTVEDIHWMDKTSEEFLDYLIGWLANTPIMLLLLYRPEYTHPWGSKSYYTKVGLDQLGSASSNELIEAVLEKGEVVPELSQFVFNRAAGNPLFMEELIHTLLEKGSIERKDGKFVLSEKASDIQVPDTIQGIIAARMDRLEDNLKRTMQVASVIGRDFAFRILQTITGMQEELKSNLLDLQGLEFIYEKSLFPELEYIFKHALTQEVAYNSLLLKRRKEFHKKTGKAIEELYPERLEELYEMLAYHYSKAENPEKAYQYLKLSGEKVARNYANREAFGFFKEAVIALNKLPDTEENKIRQIEVRAAMGLTLYILGYPEDSLEILQEGEEFAKDIGDEKNLAIFCGHISNIFSYKGDQLLAKKYAEKSFREAEKIQNLDLMIPPVASLMNTYMRTGEYQKIMDIAPKIIDFIEKKDRGSDFFGLPYNAYSSFCLAHGFALGNLGNFDEGEAVFEKGLDHAARVGHLVTLGILEGFYAIILRLKGDGKQTIEHSQKSIQYFEEGMWPYGSAVAWSNLGYGYHLLGEPGMARKNMEKGLEIQKNYKIEQGLSHCYIGLSMVHCDSGDLTEAQSCAEKAVELSEKTNERIPEGMSKIWLGKILGKKDFSQASKAAEFILEGIKKLEELNLKPHFYQGYLFLGELYADNGQKKDALEYLKKAEDNFREMGMDYWLARTRELLAKQ